MPYGMTVEDVSEFCASFDEVKKQPEASDVRLSSNQGWCTVRFPTFEDSYKLFTSYKLSGCQMDGRRLFVDYCGRNVRTVFHEKTKDTARNTSSRYRANIEGGDGKGEIIHHVPDVQVSHARDRTVQSARTKALKEDEWTSNSNDRQYVRESASVNKPSGYKKAHGD